MTLCSLMRSPRRNRSYARGETSSEVLPSTTISAMASPAAGACMMPCPEKPAAHRNPSTPGTVPTRTQATRQEPRPAAQNPSQPTHGTSSDTERTTTTLPTAERSSGQFLDSSGLTVERMVEAGFNRRADLLAARARLAIAEGRLMQAGLRPNPELEAEYGSARFLAGEAESEFDVGVSQVFETGGKRRKRVAVSRLDLQRTRADVLALERQFAAEIRAAYARAVAAGNQLDTLERLIVINEELVRVTNERLKEGDVAPLELGLVSVETDRLRAQVARTRAELESEIISLRALAGFETTEPLRIAPLPERPPRLDLSVAELTDIALRERPDLRRPASGKSWGRLASGSPSRKRCLTLPGRCATRAKDASLIFRRRSASAPSVRRTIRSRSASRWKSPSSIGIRAKSLRRSANARRPLASANSLRRRSAATWRSRTAATARQPKPSSCTRRGFSRSRKKRRDSPRRLRFGRVHDLRGAATAAASGRERDRVQRGAARLLRRAGRA